MLTPTKEEVAKMATNMLTAIVDNLCGKDCADKPPGLYCGVCRLLNEKATALRWTLGLERNP